MATLKQLANRLKRLKTLARHQRLSPSFLQYRDDPLAYISDVLRLSLTQGQVDVVEALLKPPRRVLVSSGHSVGKTILAAALVNWWFDTRDPSICLTTAPTDRQVKDLLWKEVRSLRQRAKLPVSFVGPSIPRLETHPTHFAHGFTAREATRFQGHHSPGGVFLIFDEADGVDPAFWESALSMLDDESFWLCCYNPTGNGTAAHLAEAKADETGGFTRINLSCLDHPNVINQLQGKPLAIPGAITLNQVKTMLQEDSMTLGPSEASAPGDVELDGQHYRPGPIAESRALGRRPSTSSTGLWSDVLWARMLAVRLQILDEWPIAIGCDVARYGDDSTVIMVRKGLCLLHAEVHTKQSTKQIATRLHELCDHFKDSYNSPRRIPCMIDEGGIGGGVIDQANGHLFVGVNASCKPRNPLRYFNVRSELWFTAREPALSNQLDVSRISPAYLSRLKSELLVAKYQVIPGTDKLRLSSKDDMKAILKRSPDFADCFNLTLYPPGVIRT